MDLVAFSNWLRTTITGLIILGALGSIISIWVFKLFNIFLRLAKTGHKSLKKWEYRKGWNVGIVMGYVQSSHDQIVLTTWFSHRIARLIIAVTSFLAFLIALVFMLLLGTPEVVTKTTLIMVTVCFLLLRWIYEEFRCFRGVYNEFVQPIIDKSANIREEHVGKNYDDKK
jgi:hypothetical protein